MSIEFWNASCFFLILGAIMMAAGVCLKYYGEQLEPLKGRAEARVVDIIPLPRTGDATLSEFRNRQAAIFEYYADGKLIKVVDPSDTYPCPYTMNQKVMLCYDLNSPEEFKILDQNKWYLAGKWIHIGGIAAVCLGCVFFLMHAARIEF